MPRPPETITSASVMSSSESVSRKTCRISRIPSSSYVFVCSSIISTHACVEMRSFRKAPGQMVPICGLVSEQRIVAIIPPGAGMFHEIRPLSGSTLSSVQFAVIPVPNLLARRGAKSLPFRVAEIITASGPYFFTSAVRIFVNAVVRYSAKRASSTRMMKSGSYSDTIFTAASVSCPITTAIT